MVCRVVGLGWFIRFVSKFELPGPRCGSPMSTRVKYHKYHTSKMVAPSAGVAVIRRGRSADNRMAGLPGTVHIPLSACGFRGLSAQLRTLG